MSNYGTVLITGSTGFIGSHLAKHLVSKKVHVRGLIKDLQTPTDTIKALQMEKTFGDMTSLDDMRKATKGCDIIVHCAVGLPEENAIGTETVLKAALENKIKKVVHLSSTVVFGYWPTIDEIKDGRLNYKYLSQNYLNEYCHSKIESERLAFSYFDSYKLPVVVLRLSNVFGPNSSYWTKDPIRMIQEECYTTIDGGYTPSNTIYVDNVVDAIQLAITEDQAVGNAFIISDDHATIWRDFFSSYQNMLPEPHSLKDITLSKLRWQRRKYYARAISSNLKGKMASLMKSTLQNIKLPSTIQHTNSFMQQTSNDTNDGPLLSIFNHQFLNTKMKSSSQVEFSKLPPLWLEKSLTLPYQYPINGAYDILGFKPRTSFSEGMKQTAKWLNTEIN
jgi:nucleoside-diphosphate-sugar epimerase